MACNLRSDPGSRVESADDPHLDFSGLGKAQHGVLIGLQITMDYAAGLIPLDDPQVCPGLEANPLDEFKKLRSLVVDAHDSQWHLQKAGS